MPCAISTRYQLVAKQLCLFYFVYLASAPHQNQDNTKSYPDRLEQGKNIGFSMGEVLYMLAESGEYIQFE